MRNVRGNGSQLFENPHFIYFDPLFSHRKFRREKISVCKYKLVKNILIVNERSHLYFASNSKHHSATMRLKIMKKGKETYTKLQMHLLYHISPSEN